MKKSDYFEIGQIVEIDNYQGKLKVVESYELCVGCAFSRQGINWCSDIKCCIRERVDSKSVIFVELPGVDVENKTTHILVPHEPTEEMIQAACLSQCDEKKYETYEEWRNDHTTGIVERIRKYLVEDYKTMLKAYKHV